MSEPLTLESLAQTVEQQATQLASLNERLEDLEDLQDLQEAILRNAGRPLHHWETVREEIWFDRRGTRTRGQREPQGRAGGGVLMP